jgi:hypothetical protein
LRHSGGEDCGAHSLSSEVAITAVDNTKAVKLGQNQKGKEAISGGLIGASIMGVQSMGLALWDEVDLVNGSNNYMQDGALLKRNVDLQKNLEGQDGLTLVW